ncbi:MAG: transglycosylase SLT domain-containing protein [Bryobacteraceae bacterium]
MFYRPFRPIAWLALLPLAIGSLQSSLRDDVFEPTHRLSGIGVDREQLTDAVLAKRTELMIEAQTFTIMRDPQALAGARRINSPKLQKIFEGAARTSGFPAPLIAAISYLESWGDPRAESPAGPKGIMQISSATARRMGLQIVDVTRYRIVTERNLIHPKRGKVFYRVLRRKTPYTVRVRDDRLSPERAIPAAARYLSEMESKFGGRDLAVFSYHCGEGCVGEFLSLANEAAGVKNHPITVPRIFFSCSPAYNKDLYEAFKRHMDRDYSPTYWFRVMRAEQLLALYRKDPEAFEKLAADYRNAENPEQRAPHRLSVWLKPQDDSYRSGDEIRLDPGKKLAKAFDNPRLFGFTLRKGNGGIGDWDPANAETYLQASPSALGTLTYIAFETRRLHQALKPRGETFVPLVVTALVRPVAYQEKLATRDAAMHSELPDHGTGQVFDIDYSRLPAGEKECLDFILDDLGWDGYLGFVEEAANSNTLHIGCSPSSREFFAEVFQEALGAKR